MNTSFYSALAGLSAYSGALNVVGNNLSNLNTSGFKASDISFEDLVTRTFGGIATNGAGNPMQVGLGTLPNNISGVFSQGSIQNTQDPTNVAMEGSGFFVVGETTEDRFYTRAGNFFFDSEGNLINPGGKYVLGYGADATGAITASGGLEIISIPPNSTSGPQATQNLEVFSNLDVREANGTQYATSATVYDSKGAPHTITINFYHNQIPPTAGTGVVAPAGGNDWWSYEVTIPGADQTTGVAGTPTVLSEGYIEFDGTGTLATINGAAVPGAATNVAVTVANLTNGADDLVFNWNMVDGDNVPIITGYPIASSTSATNTDGYPPGNITSVVVDGDGILQGVYSNGRVENVAQLAVANFNNPKGLLKRGRNLYSETLASGDASIGSANTGGRGSVIGSSLEASNVDIAVEFTRMLVYERGYQANSKIITAADTLTQTALALVR